MALTKEDLQKIRLPLSDEMYVRLREEELKTNGEVWKLASRELRDGYENLMMKYFDRHYGPETDESAWEIIWGNEWFPPQTEKYKDYPDHQVQREQALALIEEWHRKHPDS